MVAVAFVSPETAANQFIFQKLAPGQRYTGPFKFLGLRCNCTPEEVSKRQKALKAVFHSDQVFRDIDAWLGCNFPKQSFSEQD